MPAEASTPDVLSPAWLARQADRFRYALLGLAVALFVATFTMRWRPGSDSAAVLVLARHFAETGQLRVLGGYHEGVMPGYPWLLALLESFADPATLAIVLNAMALAAWAAFVFFAVRNAFGRSAAVVVTGLCLCSARTIEAAADVLPDMLFASVLAALLWWESRPRRWVGRLLGVGLLLACLLLLRSVGVLVMLAWLLALVWEAWHRSADPTASAPRSNVTQRAIAAASLLGMALALLLVVVVPGLRRDVVALLNDWSATGWRGVVDTSWEAFTAAIPEAILGVDPTPYGGSVLAVLSLLGIACVMGRRPLWGCVVVLMAAPWFVFIATPRYVVPILPVIYLGWWLLACAWHRRPGGAGRWAGLALVVLLVGNLVGVGRLIYEQRQPAFLETFGDGRFVTSRASGDWLRMNTTPGTRVLCSTREHGVLSYWSDRAVLTAVSTPAINAGRLLLVEPAEAELLAGVAQQGWLLSEPLATFAAPPGEPAWTLREVLRPERDGESPPTTP